MWFIIKLDKNLANQISAWEVVERPVSIVKELVENSIDANSTQITVEIKSGWKTQIIVKDNGSWIQKDDLAICLEKYTTSKIKSLQDLYNVMTFWFRWEALASISSVSKISIISKTKDSIEWNRLDYIDNNQNILTCMSSDGTTIIVNDLFYNTPARLNYLKQDKTEYLKILSYMQEISLSYPKIGFEFINDEKTVFKYNSLEDLKTRIYHIYWQEISENVVFINFEMVWIKVSGYISDPKVSYNNKNRQNIFVNSRPIFSPLISKAINDAYNRFIPHWSYPVYVLNIDVDPTLVDVNVHPRKQEVRFANEQNIFRSVYYAILNKLESNSLIKQENNFTSQENSFIENISKNQETKPPTYYTWSGTKFKDYSPYKDTTPNPNQFKFSSNISNKNIENSIEFTKNILKNDFVQTQESQKDLFQSNDLHDTKLWKIIWQSFNSYIIVEKDNTLFIYDQHALAERIIYEKLLKNDKKSLSQKLLISENIKLTPNEIDILTTNIDIIKDMWFEIDFLSNWIISIETIPEFIKKQDLKDIFIWIINDISSWIPKSNTLQEVKNKVFAYMACRSAIKFGNKLNLFEINKLLNDAVLWYSSTCPHGRPVIYEISLNELKGKYER